MPALFDAYFREGGAGNIGNALRLASALVRGETFEAPAPVPLGPAILMSADGSAIDVPQWARRRRARSAAHWSSSIDPACSPTTSRRCAHSCCNSRREGLDPAAVAVTSLKDPAAAEMIDALIAARRPSVIINTTAFSARRADDTHRARRRRLPRAAGGPGRDEQRGVGGIGPRPGTQRPCHACGAARARRTAIHARHLVQGRDAGRRRDRIRRHAA